MTKTGRLIIGVGIGVIVFIVAIILLFVAIGGNSAKNEKVTLEFWGTFDSEDLFGQSISAFKEINKNVSIVYKKFPFEEYEATLVNAFASETGPDIWLMHNTWLPKHMDRIAPMPTSINGQQSMSITEFENTFVDVAKRDLTAGGKIFAFPLYVDTLALYYNRDLLNSKGLVRPPSTWEEFVEYIPLLTSRNVNNDVVQSAAAIGTARNINRSTDLLMLLMLQTGTRMTDEQNISATFASPVQGISTGINALRFYTDFANRLRPEVYTWDDTQNYSIDAFAQGKTAMMFNYSHHIQTIRDRSARFNFAVAEIPQPEDALIDVTFANYWAPTVAKQSAHPEVAWQFLSYLASREGSTPYITASGRPSARRDIIDQQKGSPDLGVFALQALSARSWFQADNVAIETIFADMIDNVNLNRLSIPNALDAAQRSVNVIMSKNRR